MEIYTIWTFIWIINVNVSPLNSELLYLWWCPESWTKTRHVGCCLEKRTRRWARFFFAQAQFKFVKQCAYGTWPSYKTKMIYDVYELPTKNGDWWWFTYQTYISKHDGLTGSYVLNHQRVTQIPLVHHNLPSREVKIHGAVLGTPL